MQKNQGWLDSTLFRFLALPAVQWITMHLFFQKWVIMDKHDHRVVTFSNRHTTEGNKTAKKTKWWTWRPGWQKQVIYEIQGAPCYIGFDDVFGHRMVALKRVLYPGQRIALGVGNEPASFFLLVTRDIYASCKPELICVDYWPKDDLAHTHPKAIIL